MIPITSFAARVPLYSLCSLTTSPCRTVASGSPAQVLIDEGQQHESLHSSPPPAPPEPARCSAIPPATTDSRSRYPLRHSPQTHPSVREGTLASAACGAPTPSSTRPRSSSPSARCV